MPSREDDVVVQLREENARLVQRVSDLEALNERLESRIADLEAELSRHSGQLLKASVIRHPHPTGGAEGET